MSGGAYWPGQLPEAKIGKEFKKVVATRGATKGFKSIFGLRSGEFSSLKSIEHIDIDSNQIKIEDPASQAALLKPELS